MTWARGAAFASVLVLGAAAAACGGSSTEESGPPALTPDELKDPAKCQSCHPDAFDEWSRSMHAYAADDPVFWAMNARGQRETKGKLGEFCVKCHAPVALHEGETKDGTNLDQVPSEHRGVTCWFCHSATSVEGTHNAPIKLASDGVMRASIQDPPPVKTTAHQTAYEALLDREQTQAASFCGSCHDIVTTGGAHIERTFEEWQGTVFSHGAVELTCGECHMTGREGYAAHAPGTFTRRVHDHDFPAVDLALTDFPGQDILRQGVQASLDTSLQSALCVKESPGFSNIQVVLDNVGAGHFWPSGAAQDRRAWLEVTASAKGQVVYQSGVVPKGESPTQINDPDVWILPDLHVRRQAESRRHVLAASLRNQIRSVARPSHHRHHQPRLLPDPRDPELPTPERDADRSARRRRQRQALLRAGRARRARRSGEVGRSRPVKATKDADALQFQVAGVDLHWTEKAATIHYLDNGLPVSCVSIGLTAGANAGNPAPPSRCTK